MFRCLLALTLSQAVPQPDEHAAIRQMLIDQYQEADQLIAEYQDSLDRMARPPNPMLGLRLEIVDQGGQPPRRATMVTGILPNSPAATRGIRAGDRIAAIGAEPLDHESGKAVMLYLSNYAEAVPLTVERGSERLELTLRWQVIPCLARANKKFEAAKWRTRFAKLRTILQGQGSSLSTTTTTEELQSAFDNLKKGSALGAKMLDDIALERGQAMATECVP